MDYKKAYKEALAHAREIHRNEEEKRRDMEFIFPELKESEDEKIRKDLIAIFKGEIPYTSEEDNKRYVAWLEKQGQKPIIEMKTPEESLGIDSETYNNIVNDCIFGENKPKFKIGDWVTIKE